MYTEIGSFNAKAKLSELLQKVKHGQRYTITLRGHPIADLVPSKGVTLHGKDVRTAIELMRNIQKVKGISEETLAEWITEGRR